VDMDSPAQAACRGTLLTPRAACQWSCRRSSSRPSLLRHGLLLLKRVGVRREPWPRVCAQRIGVVTLCAQRIGVVTLCAQRVGVVTLCAHAGKRGPHCTGARGDGVSCA